MKKYSVLLAVLLFSTTAVLRADTMVFDRGLPTSGVNAPVSADRSNVAWGDQTPYGGQNWAIGDDFTLGSATQITDLRVWIVGTDSLPLSAMWNDLTLFGGDTTSVGVLSTTNLSGIGSSNPDVVLAKITDPKYTGSSGGSIDIWQVDFLLNWNVSSGLHTFFVGGTPTALNITDYGVGISPFLHASNAALSGSTQDGADNLFREYGYGGSTADYLGTVDSNGNGWDKSSDINVQILATPEPSAYILLGTVLLSLVLLTRKKKHQEQR
jgi:hypothetical protein